MFITLSRFYHELVYEIELYMGCKMILRGAASAAVLSLVAHSGDEVFGKARGGKAMYL